MTLKKCPACGKFIDVDPTIKEDKCPLSDCKTPYVVHHRLSGFTIEPIFNPDKLSDQLLEFIYENPCTCAVEISQCMRKPTSTVRAHLKKLDATGLIIISTKKKTKLVRCSEKYVYPEKPVKISSTEICVECGKPAQKRGKCQACVSREKEIYRRFKELSAEAERNINALQRNKNAVTA